MSKVWQPPECPLCKKPFTGDVRMLTKPPIRLWVCHTDKIAIRQDDPFVGKWDQAHAQSGGKILCPNCNAEMRYFSTATGFMKAKCPKTVCGCVISNMEPDREEHRIATPEKPSLLQ